MDFLIKAPKTLTLYGAALAIAALVIAVMLAGMTAGPAMAQEPRTGDNFEEYSKPYPCSEEVEPDAYTAELAGPAYYAIFDAFWDYEVGHLSNNFCPPKVTETKSTDPATGITTTKQTREDAHVHIGKTVFSIPESYKVTVINSGDANSDSSNVQGPTIDIADFEFLTDGNAASAGDSVYWVRLDEPWTDAYETSSLQIGFSTALMEEADWHNSNGGDPVQFKFSAVHVLQDGTPVEAHVLGAHMFAFDQRKTDTVMRDPEWSNVETAKESELDMATGQYRPMQFVFTKPGMYLVQANVQGHVRKKAMAGAPADWEPVNSDTSITSPVQWYTFHVGPQADLDISLTSGAAGANAVPITVAIENDGPNSAENVEIEINLPAGLSAPATLPSGAVSSGCGVIAWEIGDLDSGSSASLDFNAAVASGAAGKLTVTAEIRSTTFDPHMADNAASVEATLRGTSVRSPFFPGVSRIIVEHAVAGSHAGDPVPAVSPDGRALSYSLSGRCSNKFEVHPNGQIVLASGHTLDYEKQWEYPLTLHVSDGVDADGNADTSVDDSTPVLVQVQDTAPELRNLHPTVTFKLTPNNSEVPIEGDPVADAHRTYFLRATVHNAPVGATLTYDWDEVGWHNPNWNNRFHTSYYPINQAGPTTKTYIVHVTWPGGGISAKHTVTLVAPPK